MKKGIVFVSFMLFFLTGCRCMNDKECLTETKDSTTLNKVGSLIDISENYLKNRDFDGDKISDHLLFTYSGGAHCCYKMNLKLSSKKDTLKYPFEMDGGYEFGIVDGSQYDQFNINDQDGLSEIFMRISIYNSEKYPIDQKWTEEYGFKTNYIIFDYYKGEVIIRDYDIEKHEIKLKLH